VMRRSAIMVLALAGVLANCSRVSYVPSESVDHAGIEGEPMPLDSTDPKYDKRYDEYFRRARGMIKKQWAYPRVKHSFRPCEYLDADLVLEFGILKDGRVPYVIVEKPFLYAVYNEYAVKAVRTAAPFPPVPEVLLGERKGLSIRAAFRYVLIQPYGYF